MRSMIYNAPIIDRTLEPRVTQSLACAPAGSADVATDPLLWSTVFRPLSDANQANELHGYFSMEPQEVASPDHSNQQYSITAITTSAGSVAERYAYSAYGEPTIVDASGAAIGSSSINNRYSYTGREWDSTVGLHHFRARWVSPKSGRFLGRDPIGYEGSEWNLYELLNSNSLIGIDPTGLQKVVNKQPEVEVKEPEGLDLSCPFTDSGKVSEITLFETCSGVESCPYVERWFGCLGNLGTVPGSRRWYGTRERVYKYRCKCFSANGKPADRPCKLIQEGPIGEWSACTKSSPTSHGWCWRL